MGKYQPLSLFCTGCAALGLYRQYIGPIFSSVGNYCQWALSIHMELLVRIFRLMEQSRSFHHVNGTERQDVPFENSRFDRTAKNQGPKKCSKVKLF